MLATVEQIKDVREHPNADKLQLATVLGYQVVVPKDAYKGGELIVFVQPDTCLPTDQKWAETYLQYAKKRVKAVKLRKEWSEGLVIPLSTWTIMDAIDELDIGLEVSDAIGVTKYEPPLPTDIQAVGNLPFNMGKTDENRWENMMNKLPIGELVDVSLKIDGQSSTHGYKLDLTEYFLLGRRFQIDHETENRYSVHVPKVKDAIIKYCEDNGVSLAFRGESYGNGIQSGAHNPHGAKEHSFAVFSIWNIDERRYENKGSQHYYVNVCKELEFETVPMVEENVVLTQELIDKYSSGLKKLNGVPFEGVVIKHANGSFKVINKHYDASK